jgi:hypothetical protein
MPVRGVHIGHAVHAVHATLAALAARAMGHRVHNWDAQPTSAARRFLRSRHAFFPSMACRSASVILRLFDASMRSPGFRYPDALIRLAAGAPQRSLLPWSFVDADSEIGRLARLIGRQGERDLIPFASVADARKDIACFDGNDRSGDPPVHLLACAKADPHYHDFAHWQEAAVEDARRWRLQLQRMTG